MNFEGKEKQAACDRHVSWDVLSWEGRMWCGTVRNSRVHLVRPGENKAGGSSELLAGETVSTSHL